MNIVIHVNGSSRDVLSGTTVSGLLDKLNLPCQRVVVELNGEPLARRLYSETPLEEGDRVEIVRPVAGG